VSQLQQAFDLQTRIIDELRARNAKLESGLSQIIDIFSQVIPNSGHMYLGLINDAYDIADKALKDCEVGDD
jgi:hypothetical protein